MHENNFNQKLTVLKTNAKKDGKQSSFSSSKLLEEEVKKRYKFLIKS